MDLSPGIARYCNLMIQTCTRIRRNHSRERSYKVAQNLYRLESSGIYYALFKRGSKQIRKSLKATEAALARRGWRSPEYPPAPTGPTSSNEQKSIDAWHISCFTSFNYQPSL